MDQTQQMFLVISILYNFVVISLLVMMGFLLSQFRRERRDLVKAIMAKNLTEYTSNEIIEKEEENEKEEAPEITPLEEADDSFFHKMIKKQLESKPDDESES